MLNYIKELVLYRYAPDIIKFIIEVYIYYKYRYFLFSYNIDTLLRNIILYDIDLCL